MNYTIIKKLQAVEDIIQLIPLSSTGHQRVMLDRDEIKKIIAGQDKRKLLIVGPCSAWPKEAVLEYASKLVKLSIKVKETLKIVMRVYIEKPRTINGWTGPVNQPNPLNCPDIENGIKYARDMMIKVIEMGLPIAGEILFTHNTKAFLQLYSWVAIGARSSENQEHRIFASAIDCAVGLKNPTHGSLAVAVNSIVAAQNSHVVVFDGNEVQTHGNPFAHLVLRGCHQEPNYSIENHRAIEHYMDNHNVINRAVIVDASHDNSFINGKKDCRQQANVIREIIENFKSHPFLKNLIKGFMLESFLKEGHQDVTKIHPSQIDLNGLSITDPCLNLDQTKDIILNLSESIKADF